MILYKLSNHVPVLVDETIFEEAKLLLNRANQCNDLFINYALKHLMVLMERVNSMDEKEESIR